MLVLGVGVVATIAVTRKVGDADATATTVNAAAPAQHDQPAPAPPAVATRRLPSAGYRHPPHRPRRRHRRSRTPRRPHPRPRRRLPRRPNRRRSGRLRNHTRPSRARRRSRPRHAPPSQRRPPATAPKPAPPPCPQAVGRAPSSTTCDTTGTLIAAVLGAPRHPCVRAQPGPPTGDQDRHAKALMQLGVKLLGSNELPGRARLRVPRRRYARFPRARRSSSASARPCTRSAATPRPRTPTSSTSTRARPTRPCATRSPSRSGRASTPKLGRLVVRVTVAGSTVLAHAELRVLDDDWVPREGVDRAAESRPGRTRCTLASTASRRSRSPATSPPVRSCR